MNMRGLDLIGAIVPQVAGAPDSFDSSREYKAGNVVSKDGLYYQATRDISPSWWASLFGTNTPGESDAWRSISGAQAFQTVTLGAASVSRAHAVARFMIAVAGATGGALLWKNHRVWGGVLGWFGGATVGYVALSDKEAGK